MGRCDVAFVIVVIACIEGCVIRGQTTFHLTNVFDIHAQIFSHRCRFIISQPGQTLLGAAEIEEQFTLRFSGSDLDDTPVAQDEFMDFSLDPVHCKGHQSNTFFRIETFYRLHQTYVAFLNQVAQWQAVAVVRAGDVDDEAQMGHYQLARSIQISVVVQILSQLLLLLYSQDREAADSLNIGIEVCTRSKDANRLQTCAHVGYLQYGYRPSVALVTLECYAAASSRSVA